MLGFHVKNNLSYGLGRRYMEMVWSYEVICLIIENFRQEDGATHFILFQ